MLVKEAIIPKMYIPGVEVRRGSFEAGTVPCTDCAAACTGSEVGDSTAAGPDTVAGKDRHLRLQLKKYIYILHLITKQYKHFDKLSVLEVEPRF